MWSGLDMKLNIALSDAEINVILDSMDTKIRALNHILESNSLDSDSLDSCNNELLICKSLVSKLSFSFTSDSHFWILSMFKGGFYVACHM